MAINSEANYDENSGRLSPISTHINQGTTFARLTSKYQQIVSRAQGFYISPQNATFNQSSKYLTKGSSNSKFTGTTGFNQSGPIARNNNLRSTKIRLQVEGMNFGLKEG